MQEELTRPLARGEGCRQPVLFFTIGVDWLGPLATILLLASLAACSGGQPIDDEVPTIPDVAPAVSSFAATSFDEDTSSTISLPYTDVDSDLATACVVSGATNLTVTQACACSGGECSVGVKGIANFNGVAFFSYSVTANGKTSNSATVTATINPVDDAPVTANMVPASFGEDTESIIELTYSDVDSDWASTCTLANLTNVTETTPCSCALGVCTVGVRGTANYNGAASFNFTVTANSVTSGSATAALTITPVNDAPVAADITPATFNEDSEGVITLSYTDIDGDPGTSCVLSNLTDVIETTGCSCTAGTCTVGVTGTAEFYGAASFDYTVTANGQSSNIATATLDISAVNDAPFLVRNVQLATVQGGTPTLTTATHLAFDDVDNADSGITYELVTTPTKGNLKKSGVSLSNGGTFTQQDLNNSLITYQHTAGDTVDDSFTFIVYDTQGAEASSANSGSPATYTIIVSDCVAGSQTITANGTFTVPAGCSFLQVTAWGGGGGGGSGDTKGGDGAAGGYANKTITTSAGTQYNVVVGHGGQCAANGAAGGSSTGGYAGGGGGIYSGTKAAGANGAGPTLAGAGGSAGGPTGAGGDGYYGGGGGGSGRSSGQDGGGGGGATVFETLGGSDLVVAGGGGGGGGSANSSVAHGGSGCGGGGASGSGNLGGGGGGGACLGTTTQQGSGVNPYDSVTAAGAGVGGSGTSCANGTNGKVIVDYY